MATELIDREWQSYQERNNLINASDEKKKSQYRIFQAIFITKMLRGDFA